MKILMAGESWSLTETHTKGFDSVPLCRYEEAGTPLIDALKKNGFDVTYMPNHIAQLHFPDTVEQLQEYDAVILSDCGSNTLLLHPQTFKECAAATDWLHCAIMLNRAAACSCAAAILVFPALPIRPAMP